jgi:putative hydrolase of the HAD superfamily
MTSAPIRAILLDMGKVLVDFDFLNFSRRLPAFAGMTLEQLRALMSAEGLAAKYEMGVVRDAEFLTELCRRTNAEVPWDQFVVAWNSIFHLEPLVPEEILERLSRKAPMWIVSNTNKIHFDFIVERFSFVRHFQGYILSHEVGAVKPDPKIYRKALDRAGVEAHEALFVDDQPGNVEAARALGIDGFPFVNVEQFTNELALRNLL